MRKIRYLTLLAVLTIASLPYAWSAPDGEYFVYFGTYTGFTYMKEGLPAGGSNSKGIYVSRFDPATGVVSKPELAAELVNFSTSRPKIHFRWVRISITSHM
jgi:hypothetical protein